MNSTATQSATFCVNLRSDVRVCSAALEDALSAKLMREGVLSVHGHMDKEEKIAYVRLFTSSLTLSGHTFWLLVATLSANTGIDQPK